MVLDEPRPCANGSYASPTSVCIISFTSIASLPSVPVTRPRKRPTSAIVSRSVCQAIAGCARPSSFINPAWVSSPPWPRGERAGCAREFTHQHARTQLRETRAMPLDRGENPGHLVAEGHGNGLLQVAAPDHRRVAVATGELRHCRRDRGEIGLDEHEALADLEQH